ncbi:Wzz/FepE/Etk N-terminal domain-containing protein [soil metagenome]
MSVLAIATTIIQRRRMIVGLGILGAMLGLVMALLTPRLYVSAATFIPQSSDAATSDLAMAASQFGLRVPSTTSSWGIPVYVEMLRSRDVLEPILLDTLIVAEENGRRLAVADLFTDKSDLRVQPIDVAVRSLAKLIVVSEQKALGAVSVKVFNRNPSVAYALVNRLLSGVNQFNVQTRRSQATGERQFVEHQAADAEQQLRAREERLKDFLQANRSMSSSPELTFQRERLQRDVNLHEQVYTTLLKNREEARIREVRDTPVITILNAPKLPILPESRHFGKKIILGGAAGVILSLVIAFAAQWLHTVRGQPDDDAREFFRAVSGVAPKFLTRAR